MVYRLSDPPEIAFNSNRCFYKKLELQLIKKANFVSSAIKESFYPGEYSNKINYWHSGYVPIFSDKNHIIKKEFIFMGGGEIDFSLIKKIVNKYPDYVFHIIGSFSKNKMRNIIFHGYLEYSEYQRLILGSSICIIPFTEKFSAQLRRCYFTAKILLPMSLGMPILLKNYGVLQNSDTKKKLFVYRKHAEALVLLDAIIKKIESGELNRNVSEDTRNFLFPQTAENRLKELDKTFSEWIK
jgi:hypothetical protein